MDSEKREDDKLTVLRHFAGDEVHDPKQGRVVVVLPPYFLLFLESRSLLVISHYQNISNIILSSTRKHKKS